MCGKNEYYSDCGDDACEPKCPESYFISKNGSNVWKSLEDCTPTCVRGACICKPGFVRSPDGICIRPEDCGKYLNFNT